jgi:hypothetical protein
MRILAIDPGNTESGYAVIERGTCKPIDVGKIPNHLLHARIKNGEALIGVDKIAIEMIESYGMPVGREVFETCVFIGRLLELVQPRNANAELVYRKAIKLHLCGTSKAKDPNITQALVDRFAPGAGNHGKGTKAEPGWFHGFKADIWAAYALAVYAADMINAADVVSAVNQ